MSPQTECEFGVCPSVGLRQINFLPRHKVIISEKRKTVWLCRAHCYWAGCFSNLLLNFPLSLTTAPPLTTGWIKVMFKCKPKGSKKKEVKKEHSTKRLSMRVMLVSCITLWVAVYWLMQGSKDCTVFSLLRLESPQIELSLLWSNCITSHSVNGINSSLPLKDCRSELTSNQVRVTVQYTYHLNKVLDYNCTHNTEVMGLIWPVHTVEEYVLIHVWENECVYMLGRWGLAAERREGSWCRYR